MIARAFAVVCALAVGCGDDDVVPSMDASMPDAGGGALDAARDAGVGADAARPFGDSPAFPGAEGFGTDTPGGRGGRVFVVTTLAWDGPGSFHEAITAAEPRIVVFAVSGVIDVPAGASLDESAVSAHGRRARRDRAERPRAVKTSEPAKRIVPVSRLLVTTVGARPDR